MFPYDADLLTLLASKPTTIAEVVATLEAIDATCVDADGLKWFNWLYLRVTRAVFARTTAPGGFENADWLQSLDIHFAAFYFNALESWLRNAPVPGCWRVLFERRNGDPRIARIQFALAGINAHINHDLCAAIVATGELNRTHYNDYTALNSTLNEQVDDAKQMLMVRLLGDALPPVNRLEDTLAAWSVAAAREKAWRNAEHLWRLRAIPELSETFLDTIDGFTAVIGKTLLVPVV